MNLNKIAAWDENVADNIINLAKSVAIRTNNPELYDRLLSNITNDIACFYVTLEK